MRQLQETRVNLIILDLIENVSRDKILRQRLVQRDTGTEEVIERGELTVLWGIIIERGKNKAKQSGKLIHGRHFGGQMIAHLN